MAISLRANSLARLVVFGFLTISAPAATIDWAGTTNTTWSTGTNWTGGVAPTDDTTTDMAQFNSATALTNQPTLTANRSVGGIIVGASSLTSPITIALNNGVVFSVGSAGSTAVTIASGKGLTLANPSNNTTGSFTIYGDLTNDGTLTISAGSTGTTNTISGNISGTGVLTQSGTNLLVLSGSNTYSGNTTISNGILRLDHASALPGGVSTSGGLSNLTFGGANGTFNGSGYNRAVLELTANSGDFTRALGTGADQVRFTGSGGFSASGGDRNVNLGGSLAAVTWASGNFVANNNYLVLGSTTADSTITFQNPINLNGAQRTLVVNRGTGTVDAALAGAISGTSGSSLLKIGSGILRLDAATGATTNLIVADGTVTLGNANVLNGWAAVTSTYANNAVGFTTNGYQAGALLTSDASGGVSPGVPVSVMNGGTVVADNINRTQVQLLSGGGLRYDAAIPGSGRTLNGDQPGAVLVAASAMDSAFLGRIQESFNGTIALSSNSTNDLVFNDSALGGNFTQAPRLGAWTSDVTYSGNLTPYGSSYKLGGGNKNLTYVKALVDSGGARNLDVAVWANFGTQNNPTGNPGGAAPSTTGVGVYIGGYTTAVTLTANNTLTGTVALGHYAQLNLSGVDGSLNQASAINVNGGMLNVTDAAGASNNNRLPDSAPINWQGGGRLLYRGTNGATENVGALNLTAGELDLYTGSVSGTATLQFASLNRALGATLFPEALGATVKITAPLAVNAASGNIVGGWAQNGGNWVTYNTSTGALGYAGTDKTVAASGDWATVLSNNRVNVTGNTTLSANATCATLNLSTATGGVTNLGGFVLTIASGGIYGNTNQGTNLNNGTLTAGASPDGRYELTFWANATGRNTTVNAVIADNAADGQAVSVVRAGTTPYDQNGPDLYFTGNNTYSGGTYINSTGLRIGHNNALGTGAVYINGYTGYPTYNSNQSFMLSGLSVTGTLVLGNAFYINADGYLGGTATYNGPITLANDSTLLLNNNVTANTTIAGTGNLRTAGSVSLLGSAGNSYSGITTVSSGTLTMNKTSGVAIPNDLYLTSSLGGGDRPVALLSADDQIATSAVVTFGAGGLGSNAPTLRMNGKSNTIAGLSSPTGAGLVENALASSTGTLTLSVPAGKSYSFGGIVQNGAGTGSVLALVKSGSGAQTLTGTNTYTGTTIINGGLLVAGSNSALGTSGVTVNSGGQLATAPGVTLGNAITVNNGGYFGPQYLVNATGNYSGVPAVTSAVGGLGSTLTLLDGSASVDTILSALWRARATNETYPTQTYPPLPGGSKGLISDVVDFTGTGSDVYALQISYDPTQIVPGMTESELVTAGLLYLAYNSGGTYVNAGTTFVREGAYIPGTDFTLGNWGVDTTNHVAWAVVSHNSEWAVVPEPGTMALLAFGSLVVMNVRRKAKKSA